MRPILNKFAQPVGVLLESFQACQLPFNVEKGHSVQLIPIYPEQIDPKMIQSLWQSIQQEPDARCWTYLPYPPILDEAELTTYFQNAFHFAGAFHYAIQVGEQFVGWVGLLNIRPTHAVIEIGNVYFSQAMKQSTAATETIYLFIATYLFCSRLSTGRVEM
ncbi:hypothetical protein [Acinetobacter sp. ANC 5054]|uniref:GNAT family N-acetyltransferase n=1 Tax=Acinetobacter sp. ANC 5054 TaxID=1977877 RepID=UPI0026D1B0FF|nr:hypothetical protein [Acinetobacter sp. ANC 5054]